MALFVVRGCLLQVVLTDCPGRVPDLEAVMDRVEAFVAGMLVDCGALARLLKPLIEGLAGCRVVVEPFPQSKRELGLARLG